MPNGQGASGGCQQLLKWQNLSICGGEWKISVLLIHRMKSNGAGQLVGNIVQSRLIPFSLKGATILLTVKRSGRHQWRENINFLPGFLSNLSKAIYS